MSVAATLCFVLLFASPLTLYADEAKKEQAELLAAEKVVEKESKDEARKESLGIKTEKFKEGEESEGDKIPEHLLGETTKGSCTSWDIPIPGLPDVKFGTCYDWRNSVCKAGKCRCLKSQKLSEDGEFCINPGHCSRETAVGCGSVNVVMNQWGDCPGWTEGSKCNENKQCTCPKDSCAYSVTGYWSFKDTWPRCTKPGTKPGTYQSCNKMTGGQCKLGQLAESLLGGLGTMAAKSMTGNGGGAAATDLGTVADDKTADVVASQVKKEEGAASLAGMRTDSMVNPAQFGQRSVCEGYRDAICTHPITPPAVPLFGGIAEVQSNVEDSFLGAHGAKSSDCMCRPTDCTVYSKKHSGLVCVYGPLLSIASEVVQDFDVTFESVTSSAYANLTKALYGQGADVPAEFFELDNRHMLRKFAEHRDCINAMHAGEAPNSDCQNFVCSFASAASGHFPRSWLLCGSWKAPAMTAAFFVGLVMIVGFSAVVYRRRQSQRMGKVMYSDTMESGLADPEYLPE
eukprot:TRINITY_DN50315_c0_g1_i1.p1 TRINITY_DN50315_c0_g1~~TRINITY_DN50315_c0_g1_i1.p1  ORF type:complete len:514 (-),score=68.25 TRINITY_DN50315_c0_g1_i1:119-1660(-)